MNRPESLAALDGKPGKSWTPAEIGRARRWWMDRDQERLVWIAAFRYLGSGPTREDVEEAWVTFYAEEIERSRLSYRPGGPDFATYTLHVCFKRECVRRGEAIRRRNRASVPIGSESEGVRLAEPRSADPQAVVEQKSIVEEVYRFLELSKMPERHKQAFMLKHFAEKSNEEIAWELCAEVGTVKVWAHRAAVKVQEHLARKGWV
jgi:RNA polymerase sigma factor (sigma-70 family)